MDYFLYVIKSLSHGTRYVGVTNNLNKRIYEHNKGKCRYTKGRKPWNIIYTEEYPTLSSARKREVFLKSGQGRKLLDDLLK